MYLFFARHYLNSEGTRNTYMCTTSWYDFVNDDGRPITINETDYESIRLRGKHTEQRIILYDSINIGLGLKRTLLNVQRK